MKPKPPEVLIETWRELHAVARAFHNLQPWEVLDDRDIVGVRDPGTGQTGYGCVMGSGGTLFGFCLYRGAEGFDFYRRLMEREVDPDSMDFAYLQNCLKLEFGSKSDLEPPDLAVIKELGLTFKGKIAWPQFRGMAPGHVPWFLEESEARFLSLGLLGTLRHLDQRLKGKIKDSLRDGNVLVYTPTDKGYESTWEDWPIHRPTPPPPIDINLVKVETLRTRGAKMDSPWEASAFFLPATVIEKGRPVFSKMAIVAQAASGFIFHTKVAGPTESVPQMLADVLIESIEKHGIRPTAIRLDIPGMKEALAPLSRALGTPIEFANRLPAVYEAKEALIQKLRHRGFK